MTLHSRVKGHAIAVRLPQSGVTTFDTRFESVLAALSGPGLSEPAVPAHNDQGLIGWGLAWQMQAYVVMAEATGNPEYVRRLARAADAVLEVRDTVRGVADHRGRRLPVWSSAGKFTVATATLPDTQGRPAVEIRICPPAALGAAIEVTSAADILVAGRVKLVGVSLDPAAERRVDRVAYKAYTSENGLTARLLPGEGERRLACGPFRCTPNRVALAAQTGMIVYPIASLARLARERPEAVPAEVAARIDGYLAAADEALAVHESQWRLSPEGEGYYVWLPDEPMSFAGAELPINEFLIVGCAYVQLAAATGEARYADRATAIARTLRNQMRPQGRTLVWPYWPDFGRVYNGWSATGDPERDGSLYRPSFPATPRPEDVTHVLVDLDFILRYRQTPSLPEIFTDSDLRAIAMTFRRNVATRWPLSRATVRGDISGRGRRGTARHEANAAGWLPLSSWDRKVAPLVHNVHRQRRPSPLLGVDAYCAALMVRWTE